MEDLEAAVDEEINRVIESGLTEREFQKLQNQTENDFISRNTTMGGISESLANYYTFFGDAGLINTEIEKYLAVTPDDIVEVAKKYLVPENRVVLYYLPKDQEPQSNKLIMKYLAYTFLVLLLLPNVLNGQIDRTKAPEPGPAPVIQVGDYKTFDLKNGLKVFLVENHKIPRVSYSLLLDIDPFAEG